MKTSALLLALSASASAASSPCAIMSLVGTLTPLAAQIPACKDASGYDLMLMATGTAPTQEQVQKLSTTKPCQELFTAMQAKVSALSPPCALGGLESSEFSTASVTDAVAAFLKALAGSPLVPGPSGNSTSGGNGTSKNSSDAITTPAPSKGSSATTTGIALTAAAVTMLAAMA
ncbi:hypothetical protein SPRG_15858 [Saprolegnia parasitica CBS 223.65]|uniref:Elicitin n=1 Tax=Saprolegnia parasitica (strain CBS 223.65) TaxID=695850 RepID=A0A067BK72_SAPPC|nr:hypothetical protein SPRG_15858 [Saprolegnia parasitica CBS 223.65]KDO18859.1 hypothetical protein SPRG_15858 [Saprolegnia parasitica CBS 223.65]|eukprot:XP_012210442.1 hypothetical protein SPRG_15858 [Saprolegnia parasitica CBS 223.65]